MYMNVTSCLCHGMQKIDLRLRRRLRLAPASSPDPVRTRGEVGASAPTAEADRGRDIKKVDGGGGGGQSL